jgi:hypothetical protein
LNCSVGRGGRKAFRVRLGLLAGKRHAEIYGKKAKKIRASTEPGWRNKVGKYPCGVLEQAYRKLKGEITRQTPHTAPQP